MMLKFFIDIPPNNFYTLNFKDSQEKEAYTVYEAEYCSKEMYDFYNSSEEDEIELREVLLWKRVEFGKSMGKIPFNSFHGDSIEEQNQVKIENPL